MRIRAVFSQQLKIWDCEDPSGPLRGRGQKKPEHGGPPGNNDISKSFSPIFAFTVFQCDESPSYFSVSLYIHHSVNKLCLNSILSSEGDCSDRHGGSATIRSDEMHYYFLERKRPSPATPDEPVFTGLPAQPGHYLCAGDQNDQRQDTA